MIITQKELEKTLKELDTIIQVYREKYSVWTERSWRTKEQEYAHRLKTAAQELKPVIKEAYNMIEVAKSNVGRPPNMDVQKKVLLLLLKEIFQMSNRKMAIFLAFFSVLSDIEISYKSIERCYSEELVRLTIHNMFVILTKRKEIKCPETCGDGTGYTLTITKHYRNEREKQLKGCEEKSKKAFVYVFALMDLSTGMYIGYGTSLKSEKEAFEKALMMTGEAEISIDSIRLDRYYSSRGIVKEFGPGTKIYVLPKKNANIRGPYQWKRILQSFIRDPFVFLREYYKRNNSEAGFSADKRAFGWKVCQKREERIDTALLCKGVWHNLFLLGK